MVAKKILIIAGPNGAGKTTFAQEFLLGEAGCPNFVNADLIAAGISPFSPESAAVRAGRIMLEQIHEHVRKEDSFAFETTLSGRAYMQLISQRQAQGYVTKIILPAASATRNGGCAGAPARSGRWAQCAGRRDPAPFSCWAAQFQPGLQAAG